MPDPQDTQNPQIEGLPPGAVLKPLAQSNPSQIEGLPAGAVLRPINGSQQPPDEVAARHARSVSDARARGLQTNLPGPGFTERVATGIGKEATTTVSGLANLENKVLNVLPGSPQIPTEQHQIETTLPKEQQPAALAAAKEVDTTHGFAEGLGGLAENIAEFAGGDEVLKGLSKLARVPEAVLALAEKYPKIAKILTAGTKNAVLGGAQGAVKESATGGAGPLKGAEEGAAGGALGGTTGEVVGMVAKPVAKMVGIGTTSAEDISKAAQFAKNNLNALKDWATAQKPIAEAFEATGEPKTLEEGVAKIKAVRQGYWKKITDIADKHADEPFDATNVASAVRKLADNPAMKRFPEDRKALLDFANQYTSGSPNFTGEANVGDALKEIKKYNAKLEKSGYWKQSPEARAAMEEADPQIAAWRTASNELRESLFSHLKSVGEPDMAELRDTYGAIGNIERSLRGQINVVGRAKNISLKKAIGITMGIAHGGPAGAAAAGFPILDALWNDPVAVLNRAVSKAAPGPVRSTVQKATAAGAEAAKTVVPAVGANIVRFIASDGSKHSVDANEWEKVKQMDSGAKKQE